MVLSFYFWFFDKSSEVNENLGVSPSLSVGGRAIRHSLHSAIATLRSNNTYYPLRKGRTIARQKNKQARDLSKNLTFQKKHQAQSNNTCDCPPFECST